MMKITGFSHLFKWENLHNWWLTKYFFAPLYVQCLVTVAKTYPPSLVKRWRYRVPLPRPFMSFCQCISIINTDMCVEFDGILSMLCASKFDTLLWQQHLGYQYPLNSFTSAVFLH